IDAGAGDDTIRLGATTFQSLDGGSGDDRVLFDAALGASIDLGSISAKTQNVEQLDFRNGIANTIQIDANQLIDLDVHNSNVNGVAGLDNAMKVLGDGNDTLNLVGSWTSQGHDSGGAGYDVYSFDSAPAVKVVVDQNVTVHTI